MRILIALGGNALARAGGLGDWSEAVHQMRPVAAAIARLAAQGHELVLTHGNGPQVGRLLRQDELAEREVPFLPIDVLGAESGGQIGYLLQQELSPALARAGVPRTVAPIICRMQVAPSDPAFDAPSKPVGRYYSDSEARRLRSAAHWALGRDRARGGWRRLLPSPRPMRWLEASLVRRWLDLGLGRRCVPVVAGGGGVPVIARGRGRFEGVEAVIDKDRAAALVARNLRADVLLIATDVRGAALGFGGKSPQWIGKTDPAELSRAFARGEFGSGSMAPKVEAAIEFVRRTRRTAIIAGSRSIGAALAGRSGTIIRPG
ncbi:MAG TPA: carbamate kinase [Thermoplasmata archaeon]|nr:carbamate kinase [Thermoplasmata archaeon]